MTTERQAAVNIEKVNRAAQLVRESVHTMREAIAQMPRVPESKPAAQTALRASNLAWEALGDLIAAAAVIPAFERQKEQSPGHFDLSGLTLLDTSDSRELLKALERAQEIAERVDASRGRALASSISLQPGESRGTDLAETISEIALRVRGEVRGPAGRE